MKTPSITGMIFEGCDPEVVECIDKEPDITALLKQERDEQVSFGHARAASENLTPYHAAVT